MVENERSATRGSPPTMDLKVSAAETAISASWTAFGSGITAQSAKTMTPSSPQPGSGWTMTNADDTVLRPGAGPMQCNAARTVSPVVRTAPPIEPSAIPAPTSSEAK